MKTKWLTLSFLYPACGTALCVCWLASCKDKPAFHAPLTNEAAVHPAIEDSIEPNQTPAWIRPRTEERRQERTQMVDWIRRVYGLDEPQILEAMQNVPRHWFVPGEQQANAYIDSPLPIGEGQTISQPFIVAYMTHSLAIGQDDRVLEIGTGSGYQAAVLNEFTPHVFTIEIIPSLGARAIRLFKEHRYTTLRVKIGDGYKGWPEFAPFDAIIVTCAPDNIPPPLLEQLKPGGRMIIPVGDSWNFQELVIVEKDANGILRQRSLMPVRFVPLIREKK